jgi:hypothetical protein
VCINCMHVVFRPCKLVCLQATRGLQPDNFALVSSSAAAVVTGTMAGTDSLPAEMPTLDVKLQDGWDVNMQQQSVDTMRTELNMVQKLFSTMQKKWFNTLQEQIDTLNKQVSGLQLYTAEAEGLAAGTELLTACRALLNPGPGWGWVHRSGEPKEQQDSAQYVQAVACILANTDGLAKDAPDFAEQSRRLMTGPGSRVLDCSTLEAALLKVQRFKERGLMRALKRVHRFCYKLLTASDVMLQLAGPPRVLQLAALALKLLQYGLSGVDEQKPWVWSANYSRYTKELTGLRQKSAALGRDNKHFASLADKVFAEVVRYGPKSPQVLSTRTGNQGRVYVDLRELQQAVQRCNEVHVIATARGSSSTSATSGGSSSGSSDSSSSGSNGGSSNKLDIFTPEEEALHAFAAAVLDHILPQLPDLLQKRCSATGTAVKVGTNPLLSRAALPAAQVIGLPADLISKLYLSIRQRAF